MSNSYYNAGSFPATGAPATSASMRAELALIAAGFDKLPTLTGNGNKLVLVNSGGTGLTVLAAPAGDLVGTSAAQTLTNKTINLASNTLTGTLAQFNAALSDANFASIAGTETLTNKTLTAPVIATIVNTGTLTLPTSSDTLVGRGTTDTLTNKTISGSSNTLSDIGNSSLTNSSLTIGSTTISLGGTSTTLAGLSSVTSTTFVGALTGAASSNVLKAGDTMTGNLTINNSTDSRVLLQVSGTTQAQIQSTASAIRFASNNTTSLTLSTNGVDRQTIDSNGNFVFGGTSLSGSFTFQGTNTGDLVVFESTDASATAAPDVVLYRNSASPAASDQLGVLIWRGKDSGAADQQYARIGAEIVDPTAGSEDGDLWFETTIAGAATERMRLNAAGLSLASGTDLTLNGGTANGVAYLNGSKVLTTGSALTFDGSTFQADTSGFRIGKSPADSPSANIYASVIADVNQTSELWIGANTASVVGGSFLSGLGFYNTDNTTPGANLSGIKAYIKDSTGSMYLNFYAGNTYYAANTPQYTIDPAYHAWFSGTTEGMRLTSTGLGIGTSSPAYKLDVVESADSEVSLRVSNQNTGANSIASLYLQGQGNNLFIRNYGDGTSNTNRTDFISTAGSSYFTFSPSNTEAMRITSAGNVGIGVEPEARLHVYSGATGLQMRVGNLVAGTDPIVRLQGKNVANTTNRYLDLKLDADAGVFTITAPDNNTPDINALNIDSSGNVGIGTSSPSSKLEVADFIIGGSQTRGTTGSIVIRSREESDITRASIGVLRSSGASYFGRAVEPSTTVTDGFNGGFTATTGGGAWVIGNGGETYFTAFPSAAMTKGSALSMQERLRIDSSGNVGIGTSSPSYRLDVQSTSTGTVASFRGSDASRNLFITSSTTTNNGDTYTLDANSVSGVLAFATTSTERMRITSAGDVGIRTATPEAQLDIYNPSGTTGLVVKRSTTMAAAPYVRLLAGSAYGLMDFTGGLAFRTSAVGGTPAEVVRIDSAGSVGIGLTAMTERLQLASGFIGFNRATGVSNGIAFATDNNIGFSLEGRNASLAGVVREAIKFEADNTLGATFGRKKIAFYTQDAADTTTVGVERMQISSAGNVGIGTSSPAVKLDVSGQIRASSGILFGTDTAAANALDDYEEGTWTPAFTFGTSGSVTYTNQAGYYRKIGSLVFIECNITIASVSSPTGAVTVENLPFTVFNGTENVPSMAVGIVRALVTARPDLKAYCNVNTTRMVISTNASTAAFSSLQGSDLKASSSLFFSGSFISS